MIMKILKNKLFLCLTIVSLSLINCLYEDQAGTYDWLVQFVGKPKSINYIDDRESVQRIIVSSEQNVLAMINGKDGVLGWRHVYEKSNQGRIDDVKLIGQKVLAVFGGGYRVQLLQTSSGIVEWESHIPSHDPLHPAKLISNAGTIGVLTSKDLTVFSIESGAVKFTSQLKEGEVLGSVFQGGNGIRVVTKDSSSIVSVTTYTSNQPISTQMTSLWIEKAECMVTKGGGVVCLDSSTNKLHSSMVASNKTFNTLPLSTPMEAARFVKLESTFNSGLDLFALKVNDHTIQVYTIQDGVLETKFNFNEALTVQLLVHKGVLALAVLKRLSIDKLQLEVYNVEDKAKIFEQSFHFHDHHGDPTEMYGVRLWMDARSREVFSLLLTCFDHSIVFVRQSGKHLWTREESLSSIISSQLIDLPISHAQAEIKDEFASGENVFEMFCKRITSQLHQLKAFLESIKQAVKQLIQPSHHHHHHHHHQHQAVEQDDDDDDGGEEDDDDENDDATLTRDEFNLNKIIVAVTSVGKIYGIDASTGRTVWKVLVRSLTPLRLPTHHATIPLLLQRATNHYPHPPICTLVGVHELTGRHLTFSFNPITGKELPLLTSPSSSSSFSSSSSSSLVDGHQLDFQLDNMMLMGQWSGDFIYPLLFFDTQLQTHVYPANATSLVRELSGSLHTFKLDVSSNTAIGYKLVNKQSQLLVTPTWSLKLPKNHKVSGLYSKHPSEHVHSVGLPLEDRSVLYKYLNPNLVVMVTKEDATKDNNNQMKGSFNVYLVDVVSGSLVFQCSHKRASGPVHVVHSENWVVYSYWNQKHRRNEVAVLELYEGTEQSNSTSFSSLHPPPQPIVLRQAYIFGAHISTMAVSLTEKGITSKELLFALETGGIMGLPKMLVDARRPEVVSQESREEGLIPYMPELPRPWERVLSYHLSLRNIRSITTASSGLESTSLVFCYGLDLFYTRLMPSKMFDVLKEDFDYFFISSVLAGMVLTSLVTQKLAANKLLNRAWK